MQPRDPVTMRIVDNAPNLSASRLTRDRALRTGFYDRCFSHRRKFRAESCLSFVHFLFSEQDATSLEHDLQTLQAGFKHRDVYIFSKEK